MLKLEAEGIKEAIKKIHTLGKIESLEMVAEMVESGLISDMHSLRLAVKAMRKNCAEQRKEIGLVDLDEMLEDNPSIDKSDFINIIKKI